MWLIVSLSGEEYCSARKSANGNRKSAIKIFFDYTFAIAIENLFRKNTPSNASPFKEHRILKIKDVHRLYVTMYMYRMLYMDAH